MTESIPTRNDRERMCEPLAEMCTRDGSKENNQNNGARCECNPYSPYRTHLAAARELFHGIRGRSIPRRGRGKPPRPVGRKETRERPRRPPDGNIGSQLPSLPPRGTHGIAALFPSRGTPGAPGTLQPGHTGDIPAISRGRGDRPRTWRRGGRQGHALPGAEPVRVGSTGQGEQFVDHARRTVGAVGAVGGEVPDGRHGSDHPTPGMQPVPIEPARGRHHVVDGIATWVGLDSL